MFIRVKCVLQFSRRDDLQNTLLDPAIENRRIVWTCGKQGGRKHFIQLPISHCYTLQILTPNNRCNFSQFFNFYLNGKRKKYWLAAYSCELLTYQYTCIDRNAS